jgi:hypothetical protein
MSLRKPLVRYDTSSRAHLVTETAAGTPQGSKSKSMPRKTSRKRTGGKGKLRVVKGKVNLRVAGYLGVQKLAPSKLIPYLPTTKVRLAAKKALVASGNKPTRRRVGKRKGRSKKKKRKTVRRKRRSTRTRRKRTVG